MKRLRMSLALRRWWRKQPARKRLRTTINSKLFAKTYLIGAVVILFGTTIFWALLGSHLQQSNADQLVDSYLFQHSATLHGAIFPGQHTFLIKWPLFYLVKLGGYSAASFMAVTTLSVLATVAALAALLYRIERRPLAFGTICLALASVLLLVPAQPYAGGLLPVNMAMLATRNLEYVLYVGSLALLAGLPRFKSWRFWLALSLLVLLSASDKLFLTLSLGAALLAMVVYALRQKWQQVTLSVNWLMLSIGAGVGAFALLKLVTASGLTHIASATGAGPYGLVHGAKDVLLGAIYAVGGLLTNFGANPAYDAVRLRDIPGHVASGMLSVNGFSYLVNLLVLVVGLYACYRLLAATFNASNQSPKKPRFDISDRLSVLLIWTAIVSVIVFVATDHYYAVDARYLGVSLFTVFVSLAAFSARRRGKVGWLVASGALLLLSVIFGTLSSLSNYHLQHEALVPIDQRNAQIVEILSVHKVSVLVGDYWRVLPITAASGSKQAVLPLQSCTTPRSALTSQAWQTNLSNHSFAYLLSLDKGLTDYPACTLQQVVAAYGLPNSSALIAGSLAHPSEVLLFYDRGEHFVIKSAKHTNQPATVLPIAIGDLPSTYCAVPTVMNIVAHQDDDLLFLNPDLLHYLKAGDCVRTVYVTAGDGGFTTAYWLSREQGSEAAYAKMIGSDDIWTERIVTLNDHEFITIANPHGNTKVSLIFLHLPDGGLTGEGFRTSHFKSLQRLYEGQIHDIQSVDGQSVYTSDDLKSALTSLMHLYQPAVINTQSNFISRIYPDHSDHLTVGDYAQEAYRDYETEQFNNEVIVPLKFYVGYPIHEFPQNISDGDLAAKEAAFLAYAKFDGGVCGSVQQCAHVPTYGSYLTRQYQKPY